MDNYEYWCLKKLREKVALKYKNRNFIDWTSSEIKAFQLVLDQSTHNFSFIGEKKLFLLLQQYDVYDYIRGDEKIDILCRYVDQHNWEAFTQSVREAFIQENQEETAKIDQKEKAEQLYDKKVMAQAQKRRRISFNISDVSPQMLIILVLIPFLIFLSILLANWLSSSKSLDLPNTMGLVTNLDKGNNEAQIHEGIDYCEICLVDILNNDALPYANLQVLQNGNSLGTFTGAGSACYRLPADGGQVQLVASYEAYLDSDTIQFIRQTSRYVIGMIPQGFVDEHIPLMAQSSETLRSFDAWTTERQSIRENYSEDLIVVLVNERGNEVEKLNLDEYLDLLTKPQRKIERIDNKFALTNRENKVYFLTLELIYADQPTL